MFEVGKPYTKKDIYEILSVPDERRKGAWDTGYREYNGEIFIFANVGTEGRTGHDYPNRWESDLLHWVAKTNSHINQPIIKKLLSPSYKKHIFTRIDNKAPFTYEGLGNVVEYEATVPVKVVWEFISLNPERSEKTAEEIPGEKFREGKHRVITVNAYERNPYARRKCIESYGYKCAICGFDFEEFYGEIGRGYIQVHHIVPLSKTEEEYVIDPEKDLIPVCPNCHAMIHRGKEPLSPEVLRDYIEKQKERKEK